MLIIIGCFGVFSVNGQVTCPTLDGPFDGANNVSVDTSISWTSIAGVPGYLISIGTTPGGNDIINSLNVGSATTYKPPLGLPENRTIYVTLTIFFFNAPDIVCTSESFSTANVTTPPPCTTVRIPSDGATNVNVGSSIFWNSASTATSYTVIIGTTMGGTEIANLNVGNALSYKPLPNFQFDTTYYVQVIPENENGVAAGTCNESSFTTGSLATIPGCTSMINPSNGANNVPLTPLLEWQAVPDAKGYRVSIGSTPDTADVIDNLVFTENSTLVLDFEPNRTFFITIIPFNEAGEAVGCSQETFSTLLGCGPFLDATTGELINLAPEISFEETITICQDDLPYTVTSADTADGFRWYSLDSDGDETLLSSDISFEIPNEGMYRYEAYNSISQSSASIECPSSVDFTVVASSMATIDKLNIVGQNGAIDINVEVSGIGDYEFAIDDSNGPYQDSNAFNNLAVGSYTFYVRDKNGCGIAEENFTQDLTLEGFPKFFTPNGDGVNDFWQFLPTQDSAEIEVGPIQIYNRFGILILFLDPSSLGWDGTVNGKPLPSSDYWFRSVSLSTQNEIKGHFTLKR